MTDLTARWAPALEPFFKIRLDPATETTWSVEPTAAALNHMGSVHGGAASLLASEIAAAAIWERSGAALHANTLSLIFMRRLEGHMTARAEVAIDGGAVAVAVAFDRRGRHAAQALVAGALAGPGAAGAIGPGAVASTVLGGTGPHFRDRMGVRVRSTAPGTAIAQWDPTPEQARFVDARCRVIGLAGLILDTGGILVNSNSAGDLVARYVTTSLCVSLRGRRLEDVMGPAELSEAGAGSRVRFVRGTLHAGSGDVSGYGVAQFVSIERAAT